MKIVEIGAGPSDPQEREYFELKKIFLQRITVVFETEINIMRKAGMPATVIVQCITDFLSQMIANTVHIYAANKRGALAKIHIEIMKQSMQFFNTLDDIDKKAIQ